jgi:hypothetical protein
MPAVSPSFLEPYLMQGLRHEDYEDAVEMYEELETHADGEYPGELIDQRRPAESDEIKHYRKKIFVPITKPVFTKVYNSLMKIRKSQDWMISFPNELPAVIAEDESPEKYLMYKMPRNGSITNWMFGVCFKQYLIDANAAVLTLPTNWEKQDNQYYEPYPMIFNSEDVLDYKEGLYYLLKEHDEDKYWVIQPDIIQIFEVKDYAVREVFQMPNTLGYIPVRHLYGMIIENYKDRALYESRISGIVPKMNEALREYSDLQAEIVQHIHSTMWSMQPQQCGRCKGLGEIPKENSAPIKCPSCSGKGLLPLNPFEHLVLPAPRPGEPAIPTPPIGYVQKQTDIAKLQEERIRQHIYDALSAINMEFLADTPLSQSGVAKQVDREELYSFVHSIAEDVVRIMDEIIYDICAWRYSGVTSDIRALLPYIPVPERFDMLSGKVLVDELTSMVNAKVDPAIINAAQIELAGKKFNDSDVKDLVVLKLKLDPFAGVPEENISLQRTFNAVRQNDLVIHSNINQFVTRAIDEYDEFANMSYNDQMKVMNEYAEDLNKPRTIVRGVSVQNDSETSPQIDQKRLEAQASLKGTVGGVQGILEIQRSVSTGITDRDAAIALLVEIYGFTNEQASNIIGNPKPIADIANENINVSTTV